MNKTHFKTSPASSCNRTHPGCNRHAPQVRACLAQRWSRSALGIDELDECSLEQIESTFVQTGNMRQLLSTIVESDAFRFINFEEQGQ